MIKKLLLCALLLFPWTQVDAATIANDTFTDTGSTLLSSHTPTPTGTSWDTDGASGLRIDAGGTFLTSNTDTLLFARETTTVGDDDMTVSADARVPTNNGREAGVTGRIPDTVSGSANCYSAVIEEDSSDTVDLKLRKRVASVETELGSYDANVAVNTYHAVKLEITTASKKAYLAGTERISSSDDVLTGNNYCGVTHQNSSSQVDNYLCESVTAAASTALMRRIVIMFAMPSAWADDGKVAEFYESNVCGTGADGDPRRPCIVNTLGVKNWVVQGEKANKMYVKILDTPAAHLVHKTLSTQLLKKDVPQELFAKGEALIDKR